MTSRVRAALTKLTGSTPATPAAPAAPPAPKVISTGLHPCSLMPCENEYFEAELEDYKERLTTIFHKRPTHSQIGKITSAIDFLTNLDTSSISYPTENIDNKCRRADKYVNLHCI